MNKFKMPKEKFLNPHMVLAENTAQQHQGSFQIKEIELATPKKVIWSKTSALPVAHQQP